MEWGQGIMNPPPIIREIRQHAGITQITKEEPETAPWLNQDYAEQAIGREIRNLESRKAHGNDGVPGEAYKET